MEPLRQRPQRVKYAAGAVIVALVAVSAFLDDLIEGHRPTGADFLLAALLGAFTAIALLTLDRIALTSARHARLARRRGESLRALRSLHDAEELPAVLGRVVASTREMLAAGTSLVAIREPGGETMALFAASGAQAPKLGTRVGGGGVAGAVSRQGEPIVLNDPHVIEELDRDHLLTGACCAVAAPIAWREEMQGVLVAGVFESQRRLGRHELEIARELADLTAMALQQVELHQGARRRLDAHVEAFALALDVRDQYTGSHSDEVVELALEVGAGLGLEGQELADLELAARMHDIGKLGVPDAILNKQGPLDEAERSVMREHPVWGADLLAQVPGLERVATIVRAEHESWDGGGYPRGLAGEEIPLAARVILACDAFHAMTSNRPYRAATSAERAIAELRAHAGTQFDPAVVAVLTDVLEAREAAPNAPRPGGSPPGRGQPVQRWR